MEGEAADDQGSGSEGSKCEEALRNEVEPANFRSCLDALKVFFHVSVPMFFQTRDTSKDHYSR